VAGQQAATSLHAQFEQAAEQAAQSSRKQGHQIASIIAMLAAAQARALPPPRPLPPRCHRYRSRVSPS
jgi:hypothetical protein